MSRSWWAEFARLPVDEAARANAEAAALVPPLPQRLCPCGGRGRACCAACGRVWRALEIPESGAELPVPAAWRPVRPLAEELKDAEVAAALNAVAQLPTRAAAAEALGIGTEKLRRLLLEAERRAWAARPLARAS